MVWPKSGADARRKQAGQAALLRAWRCAMSPLGAACHAPRSLVLVSQSWRVSTRPSAASQPRHCQQLPTATAEHCRGLLTWIRWMRCLWENPTSSAGTRAFMHGFLRIASAHPSPSALPQDIAPMLGRVTAPPLRPVGLRLFSSAESAALNQVVALMLALGLKPAPQVEDDEDENADGEEREAHQGAGGSGIQRGLSCLWEVGATNGWEPCAGRAARPGPGHPRGHCQGFDSSVRQPDEHFPQPTFSPPHPGPLGLASSSGRPRQAHTLRFQPPVHSLARFRGQAAACPVPSCHPATWQTLQQALDMEAIRRAEAGRLDAGDKGSARSDAVAASREDTPPGLGPGPTRHVVPLTLAERLQLAKTGAGGGVCMVHWHARACSRSVSHLVGTLAHHLSSNLNP